MNKELIISILEEDIEDMKCWIDHVENNWNFPKNEVSRSYEFIKELEDNIQYLKDY